jgi:hypothetical protein
MGCEIMTIATELAMMHPHEVGPFLAANGEFLERWSAGNQALIEQR